MNRLAGWLAGWLGSWVAACDCPVPRAVPAALDVFEGPHPGTGQKRR
jgi:hypothetical protein